MWPNPEKTCCERRSARASREDFPTLKTRQTHGKRCILFSRTLWLVMVPSCNHKIHYPRLLKWQKTSFPMLSIRFELTNPGNISSHSTFFSFTHSLLILIYSCELGISCYLQLKDEYEFDTWKQRSHKDLRIKMHKLKEKWEKIPLWDKTGWMSIFSTF